EPASPEAPELARNAQARIRAITSNSNANHAITIAAQAAVITLSGVVGSEALKSKIEQAARETPGVQRVENTLVVTRPSDASIAQKILDSITQDSTIQIKGLSVDVSAGIVILRGEAASHRSVDGALALALMADGVERVHSEIQQSRVAGSRPTPPRR
ncbi:MAG: BON domain-containing protein, partial [Proteobacteria bacterium]|nr:BON domain-containing protein [Pseudomonadota bacterium]